jgi:uncharacterized RDD family membrane protein YckC
MLCPKCGTDNVNYASYCAACGTQIAAVTSQVASEDYAGFWRRFIALIIDSVLLTVVGAIGGGIVGGIVGGMIGYSENNVASHITMITVLSYVVSLVSNWLYYTLMESSERQATLGKMALGLVVTDINGGRISFGQANIRYWSKIISSIILLIGYIMAAFTEKKQALHDIIASTLVVEK